MCGSLAPVNQTDRPPLHFYNRLSYRVPMHSTGQTVSATAPYSSPFPSRHGRRDGGGMEWIAQRSLGRRYDLHYYYYYYYYYYMPIPKYFTSPVQVGNWLPRLWVLPLWLPSLLGLFWQCVLPSIGS